MTDTDETPFDSPHQTAYAPSLVDVGPLREQLADEHGVTPADVFIRAIDGQRVYYRLGSPDPDPDADTSA
jgi:hypothetical protein